MKISKRAYAILALLPLLLMASSVATAATAATAASNSFPAGAVFTMTNSPSGNSVLVFDRGTGGALTYSGSFPTGGLGLTGLTGSNQGGLALSPDGSWLFVVDAGSDQVSVFHVNHGHTTSLTRTDVTSSFGDSPISVTIFGRWVYVLDAGTSTSPGNIAGFYLTSRGGLVHIPGSIEPLSGVAAPAQISFNPAGTVLAVTEKSSSLIDIYRVNIFGSASSPVTSPSNGGTPFGFAFDSAGHLIVSEASSGSLSSYSVSRSGSTSVISGSIPDGGLAPCWVVVTSDGSLAFTTNAHSNTISSYSVGPHGTLTLLQGTAASTDLTDTDMALSQNSRFLYVYDAGANEIQAFMVHADGSLSWIQTVSGLAAGGDGLAAN